MDVLDAFNHQGRSVKTVGLEPFGLFEPALNPFGSEGQGRGNQGKQRSIYLPECPTGSSHNTGNYLCPTTHLPDGFGLCKGPGKI